MKENWKKLVDLGLRTSRVFTDNAMNVYSGYTAFYILMSLIPLFFLAVSAINLISEEYMGGFAEILATIFPSVPQVQSLLNNTIQNLRGSTNALVISVSALSLLWSAASGVSAIQLGLNRICGASQSLIKRRASSLLYTFVFIVLIPLLIIFRVFRSSIEELVVRLDDLLHMPDVAARIVDVLENSGLITFAMTLLIILMAYTVLSSIRRNWRQHFPGALFTGLLWAMFSKIFDFAIMRFWKSSFLYGSLASIFLLAIWMNFIMTILFAGASLNQALLEMGYLPGTDADGNPEGMLKSGRELLCVYLFIAMLALASLLTKLR